MQSASGRQIYSGSEDPVPYPYRRSFVDRAFDHPGWSISGIIAILAVVWLIWGAIYYNEHSATVTICSKERASTNNSGEYRIYTLDDGTFVVKDTHWPFGQWRTNSADVYGALGTPRGQRTGTRTLLRLPSHSGSEGRAHARPSPGR